MTGVFSFSLSRTRRMAVLAKVFLMSAIGISENAVDQASASVAVGASTVIQA
jgi:hypothetical protein